MDALLPSQPERYWQLMKRSLLLYRKSFFKTFLFALCFAVITFTPRYIAVSIGQESFIPGPFLNSYHLLLLFIDIIALPFFIAIVWHMSCITRQVDEPAREDMMIGIHKVIKVFLAILIQAFLILCLAFSFVTLQRIYLQEYLQLIQHTIGALLLSMFFILQLFLLLYVQTLFVFLLPLIVIEKNSILNAIKNSILLVWNHWWRTFSFQATPWAIYLLILLTIKLIFGVNIHVFFIRDTHHHILAALSNTLIFALWIPWVAATMLVQLRDLELRIKRK